MMRCDLLYVTHNRREFVQATFPALLANTNWSLVSRLHVLDDNSTDGTWDYISGLDGAIWNIPVTSSPYAKTDRYGGPVAAMNDALDNCDSELLAKIDSDTIVCPGWLEHLLATMNAHPQIDALGMEPGFGAFVAPMDLPRSIKPARWIGGVGLMRTRAFARRRPIMNDRFFGFTQFQRQYMKSAWITPDLPCFLLDHLPFEPWQSLTREYIEKGWQREVVGAPYTPEQEPYYSWWTRKEAVV